MKVLIYRDKRNNKIILIQPMSDDDFITMYKSKENILNEIEKANADKKQSLKAELIEDGLVTEILEWQKENNRPIVFEGSWYLKRRLQDFEDAAFNLEEEIAALKETIFDSQDNSLLKEEP